MIRLHEPKGCQRVRRATWGILGISFAIIVLGSSAPAYGSGLIITPTFDSSITGDPNAAAIEGVINSAISVYESAYANPINVPIYFQEGGGLGESIKAVYGVNYNSGVFSFRAGLAANQAISGQADQATALAHLPNTPNNPVTGSTTMALSTANIKALGGPSLAGISIGGNNYDGQILLNTSLTFPGSPGSALLYSLKVVVEHEINEVLGFGSSLGQTFQQGFPSPEDLYRYDGSGTGTRNYTTSGDNAFFSIDGTNNLVQFNNSGVGDYGDWHTSGTARVQDAFATPFATPSLGVELTVLDVIGYNRQSVIPEPSSVTLLGAGMLIVSGGYGCWRRKQRREASAA
jgi:hypothetical protein